MKKWIIGGVVIIISIGAFFFIWNLLSTDNLDRIRLENEVELAGAPSEVPQGTFIYELYFSEFSGRMDNEKCSVTIKDKHIIIEKTEDSKLPGPQIIMEGTIMKHKSGRWIIGQNPEDINAEEIGGCSDGPTPIDFGTKIIEWC